jgi:hypothetical protein
LKKGLAVLLMNMLAAELGYEVEWITLPDGMVSTDTFRLDNHKGDMREFSGAEKFEQAAHWLRKKA